MVGAGGVGGGYGAALAKAGADVTFIARGAHLEAMKNKGLRLESPRGDIHLVPTQATDDPKTVGPVDIVLFCVKLWDVESAGAAIKPMVAADTAVIPLQNGVDAADRLAPILGRQAVMGGVANISATIAEPGVIRQTGTVLRMVFGELDGTRSARGEAFAALCAKAGIDGVLSTSIQTELWMKFILLASNASLMALARLPVGKLRDDPDIAPWFTTAYEEVAAVGRAAGVALPADAVERTLNFNRNAPPHLIPSMAVDLLRGNRIELPWLSGKVVELGKKHRRPDADTCLHVCHAQAVHDGHSGKGMIARRVLTLLGIAIAVASCAPTPAVQQVPAATNKDVRAYFDKVSAHINRFRQDLVANASRYGEGKVVVAVRVARDGRVLEVEVRQSSGRAPLDDAEVHADLARLAAAAAAAGTCRQPGDFGHADHLYDAPIAEGEFSCAPCSSFASCCRLSAAPRPPT